METSNIFELFKRKKTFTGKAKTHTNIFFQISLDEFGAYLTVVDNKQRPIETNYLSYSGAVRNLLRSVEQITDKNSFVIDWEKPEQQIYLTEHDYLIDQLRRVDNVINDRNEKLSFPEGTGHIRVFVEEVEQNENLAVQSKIWQGKCLLMFNDKQYENITLLNENTALVDNQVIDIQPLSSGFQNLFYFNAKITDSELPVYLILGLFLSG